MQRGALKNAKSINGDEVIRSPSEALGVPFRCIIAGGGTGGHLFPGVAVARELEKRFKDVQILFVVGRKRMEFEILSRYGYAVRSIDVEGMKGRGWKKGLTVLFKLPVSLRQSFSIVKDFSPRVVLGVGGYSSGPMCLAARLIGVPTAIHEQNSFPGLTNRLLCRFVDRVFISFEESREHFPKGFFSLTGNPVRDELFVEPGVFRGDRKTFTLLVMGGSQGARAINEAFVEALAILKSKGRSPEVIHQTGESDYKRVVDEYRERGLSGRISAFIQDMAEAYRLADLVVSRAGATTIFELAALGKPSILIPYPYAANQHQEGNAQALVRLGAAEILLQSELGGEKLAGTLIRYMDEPKELVKMGELASKMGRRDASKVIVDQLLEMATHSNTLAQGVA